MKRKINKGLTMSSKFCHMFRKHLFLRWRQTTYIISVWKTLHAAQQAPIINQLWKSIYGRSATNKSMAGEILQLLPSPGPRITNPPPPSNVDLEKLDICSNMVATWHVQTCSESFFTPTQQAYHSGVIYENRIASFLMNI